MHQPRKIAMLGTGLIGWFYTKSLHEHRRPDRVQIVYSRSEERGKSFADEWNIPKYVTNLEAAIADPVPNPWRATAQKQGKY